MKHAIIFLFRFFKNNPAIFGRNFNFPAKYFVKYGL
ncbi:MAG: hypothetical protein H6Q25_243 [Bacteroidetes bacterium]|nr:hypothetical protein [Bacteroidota bacterium]